MADALWPDDKVITTLAPMIERRVSYADALTAMNMMRGDYEADRASKDASIADLQAENAKLTSASLDLIREAETLETKVAALNIQVEDLSPDVTVTIGITPIMTSRFETALSHVDNKDLFYASAAFKANALPALASAFTWHQLHLMAWGVGDPWPWDGTGTRPPTPTAWTNLDNQCNLVVQMGGKLVLNTSIYPWHLRGVWNADGTTTPCTQADQFKADNGVLMTSELPNYRLLMRTMAQRYTLPPYNCTLWIRGTEYHGAYRGRNRTFDEYRWDDWPGTPGKNADMGMAFLDNVTTDEVIAAAVANNLDPAKLQFINNYPALVCNGNVYSDSVAPDHPLYKRPWGTPKKQGVSVLKNMPPLLKRLDAIGWDMSNINADGVNLVDDFANNDRYDDIIHYVDTLGYNKPKVLVETYDKWAHDPGANSQQARAAMRADAFRHMLLGGVWLAFIWGTSGQSMGVAGDNSKIPDAALLDANGNGTPILDVVKLYHDHFGPGTPIYDATVTGDGISTLISDKIVALFSHTSEPRKVALGGDVYTVPGYGWRKIAR